MKEWTIRISRLVSNLVFFWLVALIANFIVLDMHAFDLLWMAFVIALILELVDYFARSKVRIPASKRQALADKLKELGYEQRAEGLYTRTGRWGWNPKLLWVEEGKGELMVTIERHRDASAVAQC